MGMNPEIKARWVAALRSGDYQQGKSRLRSMEDKFCCLGVLCDLAVKDGVIAPAVPYGGVTDPKELKGYQYDGSALVLPQAVARWAELGYQPWDDERKVFIDDPEVDDEGWPTTVSVMNDHGMTFDKLADLIEGSL